MKKYRAVIARQIGLAASSRRSEETSQRYSTNTSNPPGTTRQDICRLPHSSLQRESRQATWGDEVDASSIK